MNAAHNPPRAGTVEMTVDRAREIYKQTGAEEPTATTYQPEFDPDVYVIGVDGMPVPVNELYCLRIPSTLGLMMILDDLGPIAYGEDPIMFASGSTFVYSQHVPWLKFSNGARRNAAQLAQFWRANNGDPGGETAEMNARQDIAWG